jgi:hypothetical protein
LACTDADEDTYVTTYAIDATIPCASGYKCLQAATVEKPAMVYVDDTNTPNYLCKKGQFCDIAEKANAGVENDCPVGFFIPHYGATA